MPTCRITKDLQNGKKRHQFRVVCVTLVKQLADSEMATPSEHNLQICLLAPLQEESLCAFVFQLYIYYFIIIYYLSSQISFGSFIRKNLFANLNSLKIVNHFLMLTPFSFPFSTRYPISLYLLYYYYCCVTNYPKTQQLKTIHIISRFPRVRNLVVVQLSVSDLRSHEIQV